MKTVTATTRAVVYGSHNAWSLTPRGSAAGREVEVVLRIMGDERNGFHLCMRPEGFFEADTWHQTLDEAKQDAAEFYGVEIDEWRAQ